MVWNYHAVKYLGFRPKTMKKKTCGFERCIYILQAPQPHTALAGSLLLSSQVTAKLAMQ